MARLEKRLTFRRAAAVVGGGGDFNLEYIEKYEDCHNLDTPAEDS